MPPIAAGTQLGRYRVERILGKGGMGVACLATDTLLGTPVVLKVLSLAITFHEEALERFKRELIMARRVTHPGICRVFDIHHEGESWFLSMEYVQGTTLEVLLRREGLLPVERSLGITQSICLAVAAAHREGVIHRDLKPTNVMVRPGDDVSVLDFGLATAVDSERLTRSGIWVGTPSYMSPEVAKGERATPLSDVYSLGVILYRCLSGRTPFVGKDALKVCDAVVLGKFVPAGQFNPNVTPDLDHLVASAMASDPARRPESAAKLAAMITECTERRGGRSVEDQLVPWNGDIDSSVHELLKQMGYSQILAQQVQEVTVLFSDLVAITTFFDTYGDIAGRKRIRVHNELLFPVITGLRGRIIKTIGDAIMAVFEEAVDAVAAAAAMQSALRDFNAAQANKRDELAVRIGLHTGEAIVERNDVFGDTVNVAARVCSKAQGEQILLTAATQHALQRSAEPRVATRSLGRMALKGKRDPFELFEVIGSGRAATEEASITATLPDVPGLPECLDRDSHEPPCTEEATALERTAVVDARPRSPATAVRWWMVASLAFAGLMVTLGMLTWIGLPQRGPDSPRPAATSDRPSTLAIAPKADAVRPVMSAPTTPTPAAPTPAADLAPIVASAPRSNPRALAEARALRKMLEERMNKLGVIRGDVPTLDQNLDRMASAMARGNVDQAQTAGKKAQSELEAVRIDQPFVLGKLERFNATFDRVANSELSAKLSSESQAVAAAVARGDFVGANGHLNRAFAMAR